VTLLLSFWQVEALKEDIGTKELDVNLSPRGPIGPEGLCLVFLICVCVCV
jgi:hypothetical protein